MPVPRHIAKRINNRASDSFWKEVSLTRLFFRAALEVREYHHGLEAPCYESFFPVSFSYASRYLCRVPWTTSSGNLGAGGVLSHGWVSSQLRTYCLSKLG